MDSVVRIRVLLFYKKVTKIFKKMLRIFGGWILGRCGVYAGNL